MARAELTTQQALALTQVRADDLAVQAAARRDAAHGRWISYSRKVFIPLTQLCRDVCHYCTFAHAPRAGTPAFLSLDAVRAIARAGREAGCKEALFTLGDKPELRYRTARAALDALGHDTTISYLAEAARVVFEETGLFAHVNPGVMSAADLELLRTVSLSQGLMLESASNRLMKRGGPHFGSPDKQPQARLETIRQAGEAGVPFTTGLLIGIGETRRERIEALLALRDLHARYGHIQEIIIQNFRPKPDTRMASAPPAALEEHVWTIAAARLIFPPEMNIQAPPNLAPQALGRLIAAGVNDWGGVSPVTPDHVNPEAPWPHLRILEAATEAGGKMLRERLALYPAFARAPARWTDPRQRTALLRATDGEGLPRLEDWTPGARIAPPRLSAPARWTQSEFAPLIARAQRGEELNEGEIAALFAARGGDAVALCRAADDLRRDTCGETVSYVVTRNINYTNICTYKCQFCAFSKGKTSENLRGRPYDLDLTEIAARATQAWARGATEVCMQGGIHPDYTGQRYLDICHAVKAATPDMHIHAFSPLEVMQGARTLALSVEEFLIALKEAGLGTLPGTAAEILDDEVRAILCPDKLSADEWVATMSSAHRLGLRSTATIMFGHVDHYGHWARHLLRLRRLQGETGGLTELVPLPFVPMEAPLHLKGRSRFGPTFRETILMHAVGRLVLHPLVRNIQVSWVKLGAEGAKACLQAGVNDLGGTLMDETISRSAGASHGQEMTPQAMEDLIRASGRTSLQRNTLYAPVDAERRAVALADGCARVDAL